MNERSLFDTLLFCWLALAIFIMPLLFFVTAPYGRYIRNNWGATINNKHGWILMEAPAPIIFVVLFVIGTYNSTITALVLLGLWEVHYIHRAFIYPFSLRGPNKQMPIAIVCMAFFFNVINSYLNSRYIFQLSGGYPDEWLNNPRFIIGLTLFFTGFFINRDADNTLSQLRSSNFGYKIPNGGLYRWISCPNYFGEIIQWIGWAIATWSLPGLSFALWTIVNLTPRARAHHTWYQKHFPDYPPARKALLPGTW